MCTTEVRLGDKRSGSKDEQTKGLLDQTSNDLNSKMDKCQKEDNDDEDDEDDCKPTAQEKQPADDVQDISDSDEDEPMKKKRRKESFSLDVKSCINILSLMKESQFTLTNQWYKQVRLKNLMRDWWNWMPLEGNIDRLSMCMRIYINVIKKNMGFIDCMFMHQ